MDGVAYATVIAVTVTFGGAKAPTAALHGGFASQSTAVPRIVQPVQFQPVQQAQPAFVPPVPNARKTIN